MVVEESQTLIFNLLGDLRQNYWGKKKREKCFFFFRKEKKGNWVTKKKFFIKTKIK